MPLSLYLLLVLRPPAVMPRVILADVASAHGSIVTKRELGLPAKAVTAYYDGRRQAAEGNLNKARARFESAVSVYPGYWEAYSELGAVYIALGKKVEALEAFEHAATLAPENIQVQTNLAIAYLSCDRFEQAVAAARSAVLLDPHYARGQLVYGWILAVTGQPQEAMSHLEAAGKIPTAEKLLEHLRRNLNAK